MSSQYHLSRREEHLARMGGMDDIALPNFDDTPPAPAVGYLLSLDRRT